MMFDLHVPQSMASLPGRIYTHLTDAERQTFAPKSFPHGNKHPVKRTYADRKAQWAARYAKKKDEINTRRRELYARNK